ncbi:MAG TPA: TetR/AcrR family transcriptional regulator C-terminal domain-containing protein [Gaiellaceae bacterium]|nr:TetR/AcrR family transcriptional regulator C-terminal domain-containing protein [Gaiellaceae bacterium]
MARKRTPTKQRQPLTRERVLDAAIALVDADGVDALSMRRLGQELGVEAMSLYNHVANKNDLLGGITDRVLREIEMPESGDWKADLRAHAISAYDVFRRHPWSCRLSMSPDHVVPRSVRRGDWMLAKLAAGGFSPVATYHAYHALDAHIQGFTLWHLGHAAVGVAERLEELASWFLREFPESEYPHMHLHVRQHLEGLGEGGPSIFVLVLDLILDGMERLRDGR